MDEKSWVIRNCRFAQAIDEDMLGDLFNTLTSDPDARYTKADVTKSKREMGINPLEHQETVSTVMEMLGRWYQHRDRLKSEENPREPNVGKIGQPPVPGRGY